MQHIVRNLHGNYLQMNNHSAQNDELSLQAKGLLMVLMSNKETWKPYIDELSKRSNDARFNCHKDFPRIKNAREKYPRDEVIEWYHKNWQRTVV